MRSIVRVCMPEEQQTEKERKATKIKKEVLSFSSPPVSSHKDLIQQVYAFLREEVIRREVHY